MGYSHIRFQTHNNIFFSIFSCVSSIFYVQHACFSESSLSFCMHILSKFDLSKKPCLTCFFFFVLLLPGRYAIMVSAFKPGAITIYDGLTCSQNETTVLRGCRWIFNVLQNFRMNLFGLRGRWSTGINA